MKHDVDFTKLIALSQTIWHTGMQLAWFVQAYPEQVQAGCLLYLAGTKFLSWFRRR